MVALAPAAAPSPGTHRRRVFLSFCSLALFPTVGLGLVANDLCAPTADPCVVNRAFTATSDSVIDVGSRDLQFIGNGSIATNGNDLTIKGRKVVTSPGTLLRTSGRTRADAAGTLEIEAGEILVTGDIDVRGAPAGDCDLIASGALTISGDMRGRAEAADTSASVTTMEADRVFLTGSIDLDGGRDDSGGDLTISGREITISGTLNVEGGDGGSVDITATESLTVSTSASIRTRATTTAGDGGDLTLASEGLLDLRGELRANGRDGGDDGGGDGGQVMLTGDGRLVVTASAKIESLGGSPDGLGGDIELSSLFGTIDIAGTVDAGSEDREGSGGSIDVSADGNTVVSGTLEARGALGGAGEVEIAAGGDLNITSMGLLDASATREANAGTVSLSADERIALDGKIRATTPASTAAGGVVSMDACGVAIGSTGDVRSAGKAAENAIDAGGPITVRGAMIALAPDGSNVLRYPTQGPPPVTSGATFAPAPMLLPDSGIVPCDPLPPTATPTSTPSPSTTPTPTETPEVPPCAGDCNGDGVVNIAELIRAVNIALGRESVSTCLAADGNRDGVIGINELIRAVNSALSGCPT